MADLNALKQKYAPVITKIQQFSDYGATVDAVDLAGEQLHLKASVPSTVVANRVWDEIKKVDPSYADLKHEIVTTGGTEQPYTIKSGDMLSKIAQLFYGNGNKYPKIAEANAIKDPNNVPIGTKLMLPVVD
jgi:nucleoid-associated protein YgaU